MNKTKRIEALESDVRMLENALTFEKRIILGTLAYQHFKEKKKVNALNVCEIVEILLDKFDLKVNNIKPHIELDKGKRRIK